MLSSRVFFLGLPIKLQHFCKYRDWWEVLKVDEKVELKPFCDIIYNNFDVMVLGMIVHMVFQTKLREAVYVIFDWMR